MDLHSNFFDEVFERNIVSNGDTIEGTTAGQKDKLESRANKDHQDDSLHGDIDASKLLCIRNGDVRECTRSDSWNCGNDSPSTDTTIEDDIEWEHLSEDEDCSPGSENPFFDPLCLSDEDMQVQEHSAATFEPETTAASLENNYRENVNTKSMNRKNLAQSNPSNKAVWSPFGVPIPPALVWFSVMKQQVKKVPLVKGSSHKTASVDAVNSNIEGTKCTTTIDSAEKSQLSSEKPMFLKTKEMSAYPKSTRPKKRPFTLAERRQRNRNAAAESRRKKKEKLQDMIAQIEQMKITLADKDRYIQKLESENARLKSQLVTGSQNEQMGKPGTVKQPSENNSKIPNVPYEKLQGRKRKRLGNHMICANSFKVGLAGSMAVCLFTSDGTSTAFVLDHVTGVNNNSSILNMINWIGTSTVLLALLLSFVFVSTQSHCRQKTRNFLLPYFYSKQIPPVENRKIPRRRRKYFAYG